MNFIKSKCFGSGVHLLPYSFIRSPRARPSSWERGHQRPAIEVIHTVVATSVQPGKLGGGGGGGGGVDKKGRKERMSSFMQVFCWEGGRTFLHGTVNWMHAIN